MQIIRKKILEALLKADTFKKELQDTKDVPQLLLSVKAPLYQAIFVEKEGSDFLSSRITDRRIVYDNDGTLLRYYNLNLLMTSDVSDVGTMSADDFKNVISSYLKGIEPNNTITLTDFWKFQEDAYENFSKYKYLIEDYYMAPRITKERDTIKGAYEVFKYLSGNKTDFWFASATTLLFLGLFGFITSDDVNFANFFTLVIDPIEQEPDKYKPVYEYSEDGRSAVNQYILDILQYIVGDVLVAYDAKRIKIPAHKIQYQDNEGNLKEGTIVETTLFDLIYNTPVFYKRSDHQRVEYGSLYELIASTLSVPKNDVQAFLNVVKDNNFTNQVYQALITKPDLSSYKVDSETVVPYFIEKYKKVSDNLGIFTIPYVLKVSKDDYPIDYIAQFIIYFKYKNGLKLDYIYYYTVLGDYSYKGKLLTQAPTLSSLMKKIKDKGILSKYKLNYDPSVTTDISPLSDDKDIVAFINILNESLLEFLNTEENVLASILPDYIKSYAGDLRKILIRKLKMEKDYKYVDPAKASELMQKQYLADKTIQEILEASEQEIEEWFTLLGPDYNPLTGDGAVEGAHCVIATIYDTVQAREPIPYEKTVEEARQEIIDRIKNRVSPAANNEQQWKAIMTLSVLRTLTDDVEDYIEKDDVIQPAEYKSVIMNYFRSIVYGENQNAQVLLTALEGGKDIYLYNNISDGTLIVLTSDADRVLSGPDKVAFSILTLRALWIFISTARLEDEKSQQLKENIVINNLRFLTPSGVYLLRPQ